MVSDSFSILRNLNVYKGDPILGFRHSLRECNFYDSFRCYPEHALDFYSKNGLSVEIFWSSFNELYADDLEACKSLKYSILGKKLLYKTEKLNEVSSEYLNKLSAGYFFLERNNFTYYFSALIARCCLGEIKNLGMAIDTVIFILSDIGKKADLLDTKNIILDEYFFSAAANFLSCIYIYSPDEYFEAKEALDIFWYKYI